MPTIYATRQPTGANNAFVAAVTGLANGDVTESFSVASYVDKSIQVFGTFGAGGSLTVQGSNDGVNWATLSDEQGNALVFTAPGIKMPAQATQYVRGAASGDGTTDLDMLMFFKE